METKISQPAPLLSTTTVLTGGIENTTLEPIPLTNSLAEVLNELENKNVVHLVVTAKGDYQSVDAVDHRHKRPRLLSDTPFPTEKIGVPETMSAWHIV